MPSDPAQTSSIRPPSKIVSMMPSSTGSGNKLGTKTGMPSGARRNKSIGFSKSTAYCLIWKSITSEDGLNSAEKICSTKILRNINEPSTNRIIKKSQTSTTFYLPPSYFPASMSSSTRSSRGPKMIANHYGSWNLYKYHKADLQMSGERYLHLQQSWRCIQMENFQSWQSTRALRLPKVPSESFIVRRQEIRYEDLCSLHKLQPSYNLSLQSRICKIHSWTIR